MKFREAVNLEESTFQINIYSANRIKKRERKKGWINVRQLLFKCMSGAAQCEENEIKIITCNNLLIKI